MKWLELKIVPPLVTLIFAIFMWLLAQFLFPFPIVGQNKNIFASFIALAALLLMLISAWFLYRAKTTINPTKPYNSSSLLTKGPYHFSRNPIYLADLLFLIAWGIFLNNLFSLALIIGFILYMNRFQIRVEERFLEEKFGDEYRTYKQKTRRWL